MANNSHCLEKSEGSEEAYYYSYKAIRKKNLMVVAR